MFSQAQFNFYEKLIFEFSLEEIKMHEACWNLGEMHAKYAQYGLKPHFLDIYQQQFLSERVFSKESFLQA